MGGRREWRATQGGRTGTNRAIDKKLRESDEKHTPVVIVKKGVKKSAPETVAVQKPKTAKPRKGKKKMDSYVSYEEDGTPKNNFTYKSKSQYAKMEKSQQLEYEKERMRAEAQFEEARMKFIFGN